MNKIDAWKSWKEVGHAFCSETTRVEIDQTVSDDMREGWVTLIELDYIIILSL